MSTVVVIQARTSSTRLPAKVLLPINGLPLVILSAKRAANTGKKVIIATSTDTSDDFLSELVSKYGFNCYRGDLNNVLSRFVEALKEYRDETLVFRLTADNVFPNGELLDDMERVFNASGLNYLACNGVPSDVPYGVSVELMRLKDLREANRQVTAATDQEHVTPFLKRKYGVTYFTGYRELGAGAYRCTVDNFDDYVVIQKVFRDVLPENIISIDLKSLVYKLKRIGFQPYGDVLVDKLVLGTAQLGMRYGITNTKGQPSFESAQTLIKQAIANGVQYLDTARAYGESEAVIGNALQHGWKPRVQVITKLSGIGETCAFETNVECVAALVDRSVFQSLVSLRVETIDVLLLHQASDLTLYQGYIFQRLLELKKLGFIKQLGVSVQSPDELLGVLKNPEIEFIQMPFNILDWRWSEAIAAIKREQKRRRITIHVRSCLLQGLLISNNEVFWRQANIENNRVITTWLLSMAKSYNRHSITDLCINYVKSHYWIDGLVIGMEDVSQLEENIQILTNPCFDSTQLHEIESSRPHVAEQTLNPAKWNN